MAVGEREVVRLALRDGVGHTARVRLRLRLRPGRPAAGVLDTVLRRVLVERRRHRSVRVETAPERLVVLLELCGFADAVRR